MKTLQEQYQALADKYVKAFVKKQGFEFTDWIGDNQIAVFIEQYFINFDDLRFDLDKNCPKGLIFEWCDDVVHNHFHAPEKPVINYQSYFKGLRYEQVK
jgi:hypothetical protein